jgi:hypothetical protein
VLGGIVRDSGDDFWSGLVIRLAITEPAVRHALLALSSVHEKVIAIGDKPETRIPNTTFAFGEYSKAISAISKWNPPPNSSEPATIPLLVCVLFICIEFLMDYEAAAQVHISQGRKILSQITEAQAAASSPAAEMLRNVLVPIHPPEPRQLPVRPPPRLHPGFLPGRLGRTVQLPLAPRGEGRPLRPPELRPPVQS